MTIDREELLKVLKSGLTMEGCVTWGVIDDDNDGMVIQIKLSFDDEQIGYVSFPMDVQYD